MYLLEFDSNGELERITPNPERGLGGIYVDKLPIPIEEMIRTKLVIEFTNENNQKYYILEKGNE